MSGVDLEKDSDVKSREETKKPKKYKVVLMNDDYTPMDFVVDVLQAVFHLSTPAATRIMLKVHNQGVGIAGIYTREIAETKVAQTAIYAEQSGHPLRVDMEPE